MIDESRALYYIRNRPSSGTQDWEGREVEIPPKPKNEGKSGGRSAGWGRDGREHVHVLDNEGYGDIVGEAELQRVRRIAHCRRNCGRTGL